MKIAIKGNGFSPVFALLSCLVSLAALIAFLIYTITYPVYFDSVVLIALALGAVCSAGYVLFHSKFSDYLNLIAVFCLSFGMGLFFLNSYPVWADWYGNFDMYGSQGGITPVIIILILFLVSIFLDIISCFQSKGAKVQ